MRASAGSSYQGGGLEKMNGGRGPSATCWGDSCRQRAIGFGKSGKTTVSFCEKKRRVGKLKKCRKKGAIIILILKILFH